MSRKVQFLYWKEIALLLKNLQDLAIMYQHQTEEHIREQILKALD